MPDPTLRPAKRAVKHLAATTAATPAEGPAQVNAGQKKTPPLRGGVVIHDVLRKPEQEFVSDQFWTKPILII